jgi:hypothetical protein
MNINFYTMMSKPIREIMLAQQKTNISTQKLLLLFIRRMFLLTSASRVKSKCCQKFNFLAYGHWAGGTSQNIQG